MTIQAGKAEVEFFDGRTAERVDVSVVKAAPGTYVEVFGDLALSVLNPSEVKKRRAAWIEVRKAAGLPLAKAVRR